MHSNGDLHFRDDNRINSIVFAGGEKIYFKERNKKIFTFNVAQFQNIFKIGLFRHRSVLSCLIEGELSSKRIITLHVADILQVVREPFVFCVSEVAIRGICHSFLKYDSPYETCVLSFEILLVGSGQHLKEPLAVPEVLHFPEYLHFLRLSQAYSASV
ncbi:hypothetical protein T02_6965 [Trichinella nativa]|uniref:Uncharacterized protein n=1 Tax=Trichinella nativa TaxID=6335 RepID=A0A0V1KML4_9BILA|nr:hypothetical protein T02_6965 [Trichinella nativa]